VNGVIVEVPAMAGDGSHAAAAGPGVLSAALADVGSRPAVRRVSVPPFGADARAASIEVGRRLAAVVRDVAAEGKRPVVLAGSCHVALGVWAGVGAAGAGVVWIDAHADFNTPQSSASGFWPGMTLAALVGDHANDIWPALGGAPVARRHVVLFGTRSLAPLAEARRLADGGMTLVAWRGGRPEDDVERAVEQLRGRVERVYVHVDLDALDPAIGPGVVDTPVPGGLSATQLDALLKRVCRRFTVVAATIATYTPVKDHGSTLPVALSAMRRLVD
jgi:arginase